MKGFHRKEALILLVGDALVLTVSLWLTLALRYFRVPSKLILLDHLSPFLFIFLASLAVFYIAGLYEKQTRPVRSAMSIRIYATNFTVAELDEIAAFYRTPIGRKVLTRMPVLMQQVMAWSQAELPRRMAPAMQAIAQETQRDIAPLMAK